MIILLILIISIVLGALSDALNEDNKKNIGHTLNFFEIGTLLLLPVFCNIELKDVCLYIIGYSCIRFGIFDIIYNLTRKLPFYYIGTTSFVDRFLKLFKVDDIHFVFIRVILLSEGVFMIIRL